MGQILRTGTPASGSLRPVDCSLEVLEGYEVRVEEV